MLFPDTQNADGAAQMRLVIGWTVSTCLTQTRQSHSKIVDELWWGLEGDCHVLPLTWENATML
jgi:hypothetical protein